MLTALHIKLTCPKISQLKAVCKRYFYALDLDKHIQMNVNSCHQCASLKKIPHTMIDQTSSDPPAVVGASFSCDILKREKQIIMVVREYITSFTTASIIKDESHNTLRDGLIEHILPIHPLGGPPATVRTDNAPGFQRLEEDPLLLKHNISIELGRIKNKNKNAIADRAIQELEEEITKVESGRGPITNTTLIIAISNLNAKLRSRGLSSREMLYQRDQFSHHQIPVKDLELIIQQQELKQQNHPSSIISKNPKKFLPTHTIINVGDLVYLYNDRDKHRARDRYLVVSIDNNWCNIRKFVGNTLRKLSYKVKCSECYKVPVSHIPSSHLDEEESDAESDIIDQSEPPISIDNELDVPPLPDIPVEISGDYQTISDSYDLSQPGLPTETAAERIRSPPTRTSTRPRKRHVLDAGSVCSLCLNNPCSCIT